MGIWIKVQDGNELVLCTDIYVGMEKGGKEPVYNQDEDLLGEYNEEDEEAWDVINLIQKCIENNKSVFEMPKEGFSYENLKDDEEDEN